MANEQLLNRLRALTEYDRTALLTYNASPLPSPRDEEFSQICKAYEESGQIERLAAAELLNDERSVWLHLYAKRMSMLGVRQRSELPILNALVALWMTVGHCDPYELLMYLSVIHDSAAKVAEPSVLFHTAATYAPSEEARQFILDFLDRSPEDKQIEKMGFREVMGLHGVIYVFGNNPIPEGLR